MEGGRHSMSERMDLLVFGGNGRCGSRRQTFEQMEVGMSMAGVRSQTPAF